MALAVAGLVTGLVVLIAAPDRAGVVRASAETRQEVSRPSLTRSPGGLASVGRGAKQVTVTLAPSGRTVALPRSFFGLSIETWTVRDVVRRLALYERALALLRVPGDGAQILRVGGDSTDQTYWHAALPPGRPWAFKVTRRWLSDLGTIVRGSQLHVIVGLNAIAHAPRMAAAFARATIRSLPPRSVIGFEVGNEPDLYHHRYGNAFPAALRWARTPALRANVYTADFYDTTFQSYAIALRTVAPRVPLLGPAVANPWRARGWLTAIVDGDRNSLGVLSAHRYPLSACYHHASYRPFPTIARLLGERASAGMADSVEHAVAYAHRNRLRFRLTEFNSVTCGGRPGVSNTFATALWGPDALFELLRTGVDGVNLHVRTDTVNAPYRIDSRGFYARPAMYGLIMFVRALGPGARLTPIVMHRPIAHVKVWAVRTAGGQLHVLAIDKSARPVRLALALRGASGPASVQRLLAPSVRDQHGVTLAGQRLNARGQWVGQRVVETLRRHRGVYRLALPRFSAALISVRSR
jgi:hypothetical protein